MVKTLFGLAGYGGGGGGGYDDGGGAGFMQQHSSPTDPSPNKFRRDGIQKPNSMVSLTVRQLSTLIPDPAGEALSLPGRGDVQSVRILGRVVDLLDEVGKTSFSIDDSTGKVHLQYFYSCGQSGACTPKCAPSHTTTTRPPLQQRS